MWKLIETVEQEVKVELEGGHTAVLRPLTPTELRRADQNVEPLDPFAARVVQTIGETQRKADAGDPEAKAALLTPPTAEETKALQAYDAWLTDRFIERLQFGLVKLDGELVTDFKALLERVRPVRAAADLVSTLAIELHKLLELPEEGKD